MQYLTRWVKTALRNCCKDTKVSTVFMVMERVVYLAAKKYNTV
jgi:hypothetical protein